MNNSSKKNVVDKDIEGFERYLDEERGDFTFIEARNVPPNFLNISL